MKIALISIFFVASAVLSVSAIWVPRCADAVCDSSTCDVLNCRCGRYRSYCGCCDSCYSCPDEECFDLYEDTCSRGYHCVRDSSWRSIQISGRGHCRINRGRTVLTNC
ncbi:uncharacterized protein LOC142590871 [Dermacentor variabilis]|uniref:uncharacterized protein LOC142590871 n=1 Tax=Dermacentor variabilis TaxID=34621 RepID=UPI003F5BD757